jgi:hypothetical protein
LLFPNSNTRPNQTKETQPFLCESSATAHAIRLNSIMSRTSLKQQLMREQLQQQERREAMMQKQNSHMGNMDASGNAQMHSMTLSSSQGQHIAHSAPSGAPSPVSTANPFGKLPFNARLENPTNFHLMQSAKHTNGPSGGMSMMHTQQSAQTAQHLHQQVSQPASPMPNNVCMQFGSPQLPVTSQPNGGSLNVSSSSLSMMPVSNNLPSAAATSSAGVAQSLLSRCGSGAQSPFPLSPDSPLSAPPSSASDFEEVWDDLNRTLGLDIEQHNGNQAATSSAGMQTGSGGCLANGVSMVDHGTTSGGQVGVSNAHSFAFGNALSNNQPLQPHSLPAHMSFAQLSFGTHPAPYQSEQAHSLELSQLNNSHSNLSFAGMNGSVGMTGGSGVGQFGSSLLNAAILEESNSCQSPVGSLSGAGGSSQMDGGGSLSFSQDKLSSSCPPMSDAEIQAWAKERQKKDNHNKIERRRRYNINDRIKELGTLLPKTDETRYFELVRDMKQNKGTILKASVDYMKCLKKEVSKIPDLERKHRELEMENKRMLLKIEQLEMGMRGLKYCSSVDSALYSPDDWSAGHGSLPTISAPTSVTGPTSNSLAAQLSSSSAVTSGSIHDLASRHHSSHTSQHRLHQAQQQSHHSHHHHNQPQSAAMDQSDFFIRASQASTPLLSTLVKQEYDGSPGQCSSGLGSMASSSPANASFLPPTPINGLLLDKANAHAIKSEVLSPQAMDICL